MTRALIFLIALNFMCCSRNQGKQATRVFNFDSLINTQVNTLHLAKHRLNKRARVGDQTTSVVVTPDSTGWADELAVFRELESVERPINRDRYRMSDLPDRSSNLRVRSFEAQGEPAPNVPVVRFYYLDSPADIRRIESSYSESNSLYKSTRSLLLEFDEHSSLRHYKVEGFQKIAMKDSTYFSIEGEVL